MKQCTQEPSSTAIEHQSRNLSHNTRSYGISFFVEFLRWLEVVHRIAKLFFFFLQNWKFSWEISVEKYRIFLLNLACNLIFIFMEKTSGFSNWFWSFWKTEWVLHVPENQIEALKSADCVWLVFKIMSGCMKNTEIVIQKITKN